MLSAIVLAAGQSSRMGQPKMALPWGKTTVLGQVIETLQSAGLEEILVVAGGAREATEKIAAAHRVKTIHNPHKGEMLESIQIGLRALQGGAALIALGDQPQMQVETARSVIAAWKQSGAGIVVPSYENRRGHPWLIAENYWGEILAMPAESSSMRDFFKARQNEIFYVSVAAPSVLQDLDTPEDYLRFKP